MDAFRSHDEYDVAIIGAGPVGLAMAIELSRLGFETVVVDRRPPLRDDAGARQQLLVAREGDLAHLAHLGVALDDPTIVALLATRCERDLASGRSDVGDVWLPRTPAPAYDLASLSTSPPLALVPIARLQQALLARAARSGAHVQYSCDVTKLRRHARGVSLTCADGTTARAAMAIIATGAARSLIAMPRQIASPGEPGRAATRSVAQSIDTMPEQKLIAGVFGVGGDRGRWVRVEMPVPGFVRPVRCTLLQTPVESEAGTALLVDPQVSGHPTDAWLRHCFDAVAHALELAGAPLLVAPQVFTTAVTGSTRHFLAGDGRAPIVIAGDAAQTGHVFSGQSCFINVALALGLCEELRRAHVVIRDRRMAAPALVAALERYGKQSQIGAALLARASRRHQQAHPPGAWALAGVARADG